jgi:Xaa-Pro aminopeptidase
MTFKPQSSPIGAEEFTVRRAAATAAGRAKGYDGLLVCSRGGGTVDRFADLLYLANYYTPFPYIPDLNRDWTGRGHGFLVLPARGDARLVADVPYLTEVALAPESIVKADDVMAAVVEALKSSGLARARVAVAGDDVLTWKMWRTLSEALPDIAWVPDDDILGDLRAVKSPGEIAILRDSARLGSRTIEAMLAAAVPGVTHADVVAAGQDVLVRAGGILYNSFMASGTGGNAPTVVRHNFPTWAAPEPLQEGQWLRLGISGVYRGYYFDVSRSKAIGHVTAEQAHAFEAAIACIQAGIAAMRPGVAAGEVARAGLKKQEELGFPLDGVFSGLGHGIGLGWDRPWLVPNEAMPLRANMVLNLERTLSRGGYLGDFEETLLLTEDGPELLTDARIRSW